MQIEIQRFNGAALNRPLLSSCIVLLTVCLLISDLFANDALIVQRRDGVAVWFDVEQARDATTHKKGLMDREHLARRSGMFFDFHRTQRIRMWMKNTLIPLDMLFIAESGAIVYIVRNTMPLSLEVIGAPEPVRYVLEVNAGETRELDITVGDQVLLNARHYR